MPSIPSLRLSYSPRKNLSSVKSIIGIAVIFAGLAGAIVATLFTEGRTSKMSVVEYLPVNEPGDYGSFDKTTVGTTCGRTVIYAGQTFDDKVSNASFDYTAMSSFSYGGEQLKDCMIDPSTQPMIIVRPPVANPTMEILNLTVICNTSVSIGGARFAPSGSSGSLEGSSLLVGNPGGFSVTINVTGGWSYEEFSYAVKAYGVNGSVTPLSGPHPLTITAILLANQVLLYVQEDFEVLDEVSGGMVLLPNVLFPCSETKKVWKNAGDVVWYCIVSLAAVFAPLYMTTIWALTSGAERNDVDNVLGVRRNLGFSRVMVDRDAQDIGIIEGVDHIPMSPTSPRNSESHVVDFNNTKTDGEHGFDTDHKAPFHSYDQP